MLKPTHPTPSDPGLPRRLGDFPTLADALDYAARGEAGLNFYSGRGALVEALPYRLLREQALDLAQRLLALGLAPGERLAIVAESHGDFVRAFFACQYAGLVPAPLPLPLAFAGRETYVANVRRMIRSAQAVAAFAPESLLPWLREAAEGLEIRLVSTLGDLRRVEPAKAALPAPDPDGVSYLQFSSGSTRNPQGIAVTQRSVMANAAAVGRHGLAVRDGDRCVSWLPFYHDMGLVGFLLIPVVCQVTVDVLPSREFARRPLVWLDVISRNRGTLSYSPSFGYELCTHRANGAPLDLDLSCWRAAGIGGDMIRPQALEAFIGRMGVYGFRAEAFVPSYGMAEATLALSFAPLGRGIRKDTVLRPALEHEGVALPCAGEDTSLCRTFVCCGSVLPEHQLEVRDAEGLVLPDRQVGTIFARGPSIALGGHAPLEEAMPALADGGWLNTGDLGYTVDGEIVVTGRAKDLIIVNGRNIWPQDLEWAAETELAGLRSRDVAVFSVDDEQEERVIALVQCRVTRHDDREALRAEVAGLFRRQHGIEVFVVLVPPHSLPQTSSGKLSRTRAKQMLLAGAFADGPLITSAA